MPCAMIDEPGAVCPCAGSYKRQRKCEYWIPSRNHVYARCRLFIDTRAECPLESPTCATCPHHITDTATRSPIPMCVLEGRQADNRERMREYMRRRRAKIHVSSVEIIGPAHPDYPKPAAETP